MWGSGNLGGTNLLNFKVVGGLTQPANPSKNTIWVNTDIPIAEWIFSAVEPENLTEGTVWFLIGTSSNVEFDAIKKGGIMVYPLSAKQYFGGSWVDTPAMSYQNNTWVDWLTYLFSDGNQFVDLTGGWESVDTLGQNYAPTGGVATIGNTLRVTTVNAYGDSNKYSGIATVNAVDVTRFSKLKINVVDVENGSSETRYCSFGLSANRAEHTAAVAVSDTGVYELDVSSMSGLYYPFIQVSNDTRALEASAVWMQ